MIDLTSFRPDGHLLQSVVELLHHVQLEVGPEALRVEDYLAGQSKVLNLLDVAKDLGTQTMAQNNTSTS